jgi:hypothetical protein
MDFHLLPEKKLAILQAADMRRKWYSLDDQRVCVLCDRAITGRQIEIQPDGKGGYILRCPTEGCASLPADWFYHGSSCSTTKGPQRRDVEISLWET